MEMETETEVEVEVEVEHTRPQYSFPTNNSAPNGMHGAYHSSKMPSGYPPASPGYPPPSPSPAYPPQPNASPGYPPPPPFPAYPPQPNNVSPAYPPPSPSPPPQPWSSGLFDCHQDNSNCAATAVSPCITFGQIAEIVDEGQTTCVVAGFMFSIIIGFPWIYTFSYRTRLRKKYNLEEAPIMDVLAHCLFLQCALCQEYREFKSRELHPGLGWAGNLERPVLHAGMKPPPPQQMYK